MTVTNETSGTRIDEIGDRIYRIHTPVPPEVMPGGFSFNQYLVVDDEPVSVNDVADRPARALADGEALSLGKKKVTWLDAPHVPHAWECGFLFESTTRTLFAGDLFTQPGHEHPALTEQDILGPSEAFRGAMDYYAHSTKAPPLLARIAATEPTTLACMHGAAWRGDGGKLLRELAACLARDATSSP